MNSEEKILPSHLLLLTFHCKLDFELILGLEPLEVVRVLHPLLDVAALGADEAGDPDVQAGQVDRDPAPAVEHRGAAFAGDGRGGAFRAFFIVLHQSSLKSGYSKKKYKYQD